MSSCQDFLLFSVMTVWRPFPGWAYRVARTRGSHLRLRCPGRRPVTLPRHRELARGTLRAILRTAGISVSEFLTLLKD